MRKKQVNNIEVLTYNSYLNKDYPTDFDYFSLLKVIYDSFKLKKTSSQLIQAILDLRKLLKYQKGFFFPCFDNLFDYFALILSSENYHITKEALILISELFTVQDEDENIKEWMVILIHKLIPLSLIEDNDSELVEIAALSNYCLYICSCHFLNKRLVNILIEELDPSDEKISNKVFKLIIEVLTILKREIVKEEIIDWDTLFSKALNMSNNNNKIGLNVIKFIQTILSKQQWDDIISNLDHRIINQIKNHVCFKELSGDYEDL